MEIYRCAGFDSHTGRYCRELLRGPHEMDSSKIRCPAHILDDDSDDSEVDDEFQSGGGEQDEVIVMVRGVPRVVLSSEQFRELTMDYKPLVRQNIYFLFQDYFDFLFSDRAYGQYQTSQLAKLTPLQKRELGMKTRDRIAQGRIYMTSFMFSMADMSSLKKSDIKAYEKLNRTDASIVKIGYSKYFADERVDQLAQQCNIHFPKVLATFPSEQQDALGFVHLLEKIIHELCRGRRTEAYCNGCRRTHKEYFVFEEIGECTAKESVRIHVDSTKRDIMKCNHFLRQSEGLYNEVAGIQQNMLNKIRKQLWGTGHSTPR
ncbi:hypothetical protein BG006_000464 [Podila minutissima]|uniref:Bacteriophage T5 Orf172 DNA-binding domain-containing protein n=1 Tax=Podila minutissima TaxID=64525 RepID=A0A9P5VH90_9FUNG|nr:hypothetical protein BG006_000464 [Podila minutissima]